MSDNSSAKDRIFLIGMLLSMFSWGIGWASGKVLSRYGDPLSVALYRFVLTFISLLLILFFTREKLKIERKGLLDLGMATVFMTIYNYLFFKGLAQGKSGAGGVLVTTLNPVIAYAITLVLKKRLPVLKEALGLSAGIIAGAILLKVWTNWQDIFSTGNSYFLLASLTWALLSLFTSRSGRYGSPITFSLWMYGLCSLLMLLLTSVSANIALFENTDIYFWGNLVFSASIVTSLATTFYFVATTRIGASKASSYIFLVPFSAALGSWLFLREIPQWHTIIGGMVGIGAVYLVNKK